MRKRATVFFTQPGGIRFRGITLVALVVLFGAWLFAPFIHAHHDDGQHPFRGNVIHAHVPAPIHHPEAEHHDADGSAMESSREHGTSIHAFTIEVWNFQHMLADIAGEWFSIEPREDWLFQPIVFPRSHGPPPDWSTSPRSPPNSLL